MKKIYLNIEDRPLNSRGGCYFCLDTKVTKRSSQQKCFFAAQGLCAANQVKPGLQTVAPALIATPFANICYALQPHRPPLFYLISPGAYLLTRQLTSIIKGITITSPKTKAGKGLPKNAGQGVWPRAGKDFFGLIFWFFFI